MSFQVFPTPAVVSGDPASKTFPATAAGTYNLDYTLSAGVYEITTDTVQSSFTLGLADSAGIKYNGTIRGGKGYISVGSAVTKIVIPAGLTYPLNINIRLGAYTQIAAPSGLSATYTNASFATFTFTAPAGATNIIAFWTDGTSTSFATTSSPKTSVTIPTAVHGQPGVATLVAVDANGITGLGASVTTNNNATIPITATGGTVSNYTSGGTSYVAITFTGSGTLNVNTVTNIDYLVVAGGGGGSYGGGGAGGMRTGTVTSAATGSFTVTVGAGGTAKTAGNFSQDGSTAQQANSGNNSTIAFGTAITSTGGGGGGSGIGANASSSTPGSSGLTGGSGGGQGSTYNTSMPLLNAAGTAGQGNQGGQGAQWNGTYGYRGGGGGGASAAGTNAGNTGGNGGNGSASSISGASVTYAGGGAGAGSATFGTAGTGGGGGAATNGTVNTGGGGGGNGQFGNPTAGGSGIVIVRVAL